MNEQCELIKEWISEWPSTYVPILGIYEPECKMDIQITKIALKGPKPGPEGQKPGPKGQKPDLRGPKPNL